ncbi:MULTISPECIES: hypothetical protein [unclassified Shinella]|uniref:hypothetical protein n=1 Tax=unclassified Shinella TaxID=2643062 RepID=UPI00225CDF19|nr:conserved hypothetical protein [Rhizobiaceae bacterium]CAK7259093.1 conserved protein of unknown function [Shinella sp. WSC3-e]
MAGIQANRYYNNPQIGQAFSNLAQLFGPPSASDMVGYATAKAKKEEAARLADLFSYTNRADFDQAVFDRMGQATGQWNPSNGYYGVDTAAATARRGQDIDARTALERQRLVNEGELQKLYATPITAAENATVYVPGATADAAGLPRVLPGQVSAGQGETIYRPDGSVLKGEAKPLSETELKATILSGLPANEQRAAALSGVDVENVVGADGVPEIVFRSDAAGRQPFFNKGAEAKPSNAVALMPDGKTRVPALQDQSGAWVHAQTGQKLPDGIQIFDLPKATGSAADIGLGPTTANQTSANNQEAEVSRTLNLLDVYESALDANPGALGLAGLIRGTAQNAVATATDLTRAFGGTAPQVQEFADELRDGLQGVAPDLFDPSIPEIAFLQGTLAYSLARTENPSGEVSRQAYERALERVKGGGMLANTQSAKAAVAALRKVVNSQLEGIRTLRAPGTGRTDTTFQGDGVSTPTTGTRMKFDVNGNPVQ